MTFAKSPLLCQIIIAVLLLLLLIIAIVNLTLCIRFGTKKRYVFLCIFVLVFNFIILLFLMEVCESNLSALPIANELKWLHKIPLWSVIILIIVFAFISISGLIVLRIWTDKHLTPTSTKESIDYLPVGVCIYDRYGLPKIVNNLMNKICQESINENLLNGLKFWETISNGKVKEECEVIQKGTHPIIRYHSGRVISFEKYNYFDQNEYFYEIIAVDVTEKYLLMIDLEAKNNELSQMNKRLRLYGEKIDEYTKEKELLSTKIHIHDDMGKLLLMTRRQLSIIDSLQDKQSLLTTWKWSIDTFGLIKDKPENSLDELHKAAKAIGVTLNIIGIFPQDNNCKKVMIVATLECMTNTVKHALGNQLTVKFEETPNYVTAIFTNNGELPKQEITEGGGLSSLRLLVERLGGNMVIESFPQFKLIIKMPKGVKKHE